MSPPEGQPVRPPPASRPSRPDAPASSEAAASPCSGHSQGWGAAKFSCNQLLSGVKFQGGREGAGTTQKGAHPLSQGWSSVHTAEGPGGLAKLPKECPGDRGLQSP